MTNMWRLTVSLTGENREAIEAIQQDPSSLFHGKPFSRIVNHLIREGLKQEDMSQLALDYLRRKEPDYAAEAREESTVPYKERLVTSEYYRALEYGKGGNQK